jgi:hypothetical protein
MATALLIVAGQNPYMGRQLLTHPWLVHLGLISYSLYLWHWPLAAWAHYRSVELAGISLVAAIFLSLLLAELSWRWVELPFRRLGMTSSFRKSFFSYLLPSALLLMFVSWGVIYSSGLPDRFDTRVANYELALVQKPEQLRAGCHVPSALYKKLPDPVACHLGKADTSPSGVLWGDSYANHFSGLVDELARHQGAAFMDYTMDACPPLMNYRPSGSSAYAQRCVERNAQLLEFLLRSKISHVVMAANWPDDEQAGSRFRETVRHLQGLNLKVTVIQKNQFMSKGPGCAIREAMRGNVGGCTTLEESQPEYLNNLTVKFQGIHELKPNHLICPEGRCDVVRQEILLYRDGGHLNDQGSRALGREFILLGQGL